MSNSVTPKWHGDNYQSRIFWENVLNLFDDATGVVEVSFEADGPKAFDDVVVKYDPPRVSSHSQRVTTDYHQVKWHVEYGGRFGYQDFIDPGFIGATSISLLQRLKEARSKSTPGSCFNFVTVYRIADNDPLAELISGVDKSLLLDKLFDGTTDASKMGKVRKLWREHLELSNDEELRETISYFRIFEGHRSLEELRTQINFKARIVGLLSCENTSDFRYDELARQLKSKKLNVLTRAILEQFCREEGLLSEIKPSKDDDFLVIAIRSFLGIAADIVGATTDNTLLLSDYFNQRYLSDGKDWQNDLSPLVKTFLHASAKKSSKLRIILDAHASIAFLTGTVLDFKSGTEVELVQKGRIGSRVWRSDDNQTEQASYTGFTVIDESIGKGEEIAIAINITHNVENHAKKYISHELPNVGSLLSFTLPSGTGQSSIVGGTHASQLAEQVAKIIRNLKVSNCDLTVHIFAACPNSFLFFLGQHHQGVAPCIIYEFDFDRKGNKNYQPSFIIE